jgi:hypothetical protein
MASKVRILTSQITHAAKKFGDDTLKLWLKEKRSQITRAAKKFGDASLKLAWLKVKVAINVYFFMMYCSR